MKYKGFNINTFKYTYYLKHMIDTIYFNLFYNIKIRS